MESSFKRDRLAIYGLQENKYQLRSTSRYFPNVDLGTLIIQCLKVASDRATGIAIRELRSSISEDI